MKKILLGISISGLLIACQSKTEKADMQKELLPLNNTALYNSSILTDTAVVKDEFEAPRITTKAAPVKRAKKKIYTESSAAEIPQPAPVKTPAGVVTNIPGVNDNPSTTDTGVTGNTGTGKDVAKEANAPAPEVKKKGWSDAAKGAVIGGVGGAIAGAVINGKNRGKGAVIGGVIGAAGGYVLGRKKDKKEAAENR